MAWFLGGCETHEARPSAGNTPAGADWRAYLGSVSSSQYSPLAQINTSNVSRLELAWTYHTRDAVPKRSEIQCNPLVIGGTLFGTSAQLKLFALDAATGRELWTFDPFAGHKRKPGGINRGLVYWSKGADKRLLFSAGYFLYAIQADSGLPVAGFGTQGRVDLREGLGRDVTGLTVRARTPGVLYRDLLIIGTSLGEGPEPAAPGHIRAYDVRNGELRWRFHTIPQPGEYGYDTWPPGAYKYVGGANVWTGMALDRKRGIVYCPTGSPTFDFWGGDRAGKNLFGNTLLALDARTGKRLWHFQFVRHDLWDQDLAAPPNLLTIERDGRRVDAVAQVTKSGYVFVFDRQSGKSLFPLKEVHAPRSDLQGESTWPTQPVPAKPQPFARQRLSYQELTDISPEAHRAALERFFRVRPHVPFGPPSLQGTIIFPGPNGGALWGGAATDPKGVLYVNSNELPYIPYDAGDSQRRCTSQWRRGDLCPDVRHLS